MPLHTFCHMDEEQQRHSFTLALMQLDKYTSPQGAIQVAPLEFLLSLPQLNPATVIL